MTSSDVLGHCQTTQFLATMHCSHFTPRAIFTPHVILVIAILICSALSQEGSPTETEGGTDKQPEQTTQPSDYEETEDDNNCEDWGLFQFLNKILCIFKMIIGLITGNPDPCCPFELPSFGR